MIDERIATDLNRLTKIIELCPDSPTAWYERANIWLDVKEFDCAIEDYSQALRLQPEFVPARYGRALALDNGGRFEEAITEYSLVIEQDDEHVSAYNNRGVLYQAKGRYREAVEDYRRAAQLDCNHAHSRYNLGLVLGTLEQYDEAVEAFTAALSIDPIYPRARIMRAKAYCLMGDFHLAEADLDSVAAPYRAVSAEWEAISALRCWVQGRAEEVRRHVERAVEIDPACKELEFLLSYVKTAKTGLASSPRDRASEECEIGEKPAPEDSYRDRLRPGQRSEAQVRLRNALAAFLLAEDGEALTKAVLENPIILNSLFCNWVEEIVRGDSNLPIRKQVSQCVPILREAVKDIEET